MRCISYAGSGVSEKRRYCRDNRCIETDIIQEAVSSLYNPDEVLLCLSDPAGASLAAVLDERRVPVRKLWIPFGTDEKQLFEIFSIICGVIKPEEEILFEITAGRHSLPFISCLVIYYLRALMKVKIMGVIYAPEPGDDGFCRFVDLKPMMSMLDWISGVRSMTDYLDAGPIKDLLYDLQGNLHRSGELLDPPVNLAGWSTLVGQFCDSVKLARPVEAMYAASGIIIGTDRVCSELSRFAPPLVPVLNETCKFADMSSVPETNGCSYEYIRRQIRLIGFQIEKGFYLQAVTLGRETLITILMIRTGRGSKWRDSELRHEFSRTLTGGALALQNHKYQATEFSSELSSTSSWNEMVRIWIKISDLRNTLAHCGMTKREDSIKSLKIRSRSILPDIERFLILCEKED